MANSFSLTLFAILDTRTFADRWTESLAVTSAHVEGPGGTISNVGTSQSVVNPKNCAAPDGYKVNDPAIAPELLAIAIAAIAAGLPVKLYLSSAQCMHNRPRILDFQST
jgi:hypothetical protein